MIAKVHIIGIGDDGLEAVPDSVRSLIQDAEVLLGTERVLSLIPTGNEDRHFIGGDLDELVAKIEAVGARRTALLVYGDPMFYGLARYVCQQLGKERFQVIPHVSSMQLAFARVMESWEEAYLTNLANHPLETVVERIRTADTVGLFTTDTCGPVELANALLERQIDYFTAYVCENLGARDERVTRGTLEEIARSRFDPLNVVILVRQPEVPDRPRDAVGRRLFGNPDEVFLQSRPKYGLLTPAEVRSIALAQLDIGPGSIVWDVGAGSGSVSIEAAQLAIDGTVYAIEMDAEDHGLIRQNAERFQLANVLPVLGKAPDAWKSLPQPDAVFVAGSGREITRIAEAAFVRLNRGGRLVINLVSLDNLAELRHAMRRLSPDVHVWMINVARGTEQLDQLSFEALKPNFLLAVRKR
jgi:precorrin-6Y C5,15-methyltransferase (decarboxylating)